jgi:hypothetical protein
MPNGRKLPKTRDLVQFLAEKGKKPRQIALELGLTTQAVYYHLGRLNGKKAS